MVDTNFFKNLEPGRSSGPSSETVVLRLREMVHHGELKFGDRLPPERNLAKMLGVSRPTLRAGLRSLVAVGVLRSRQGAGTFVVEAGASPALDGNPLQMMASLHGFSNEEMFEARISLEMEIAKLAAERATGEQLAAMSEEVAEMFAALDSPQEYLVHDMRFHQTIAHASGNRVLTALMNMVAQILFEARSKTVHRAVNLKESAVMHQQIYRAIRDRSPEAARSAMRDHLLHAKRTQNNNVKINQPENVSPLRSSSGGDAKKSTAAKKKVSLF